MLRGFNSKALTLANVSFGNTKLNYDTWLPVAYSKARLEALTHKNIAALKTLENLFKNGFHLYYVLRNDEAWNALRQTVGRKKMMEKYPFTNIYKDAEEAGNSNTNYDVEKIRIPALP